MDCVKTNKRTFEIFLPSGSNTILVFPHQTAWQFSDGNPLTWASHAGEVGRNRDGLYLAALRVVNSFSGKCNTLTCDESGEFITLVAAKRTSLSMAGNNDEVYDKKPQCYAKDNVTQW